MRTMLITGASQGIGLEMARQQVAEGGWRVIATCRQPDEAMELQSLAARHSAVLSVHRLDVTDPTAIGALARSLHGQPIDLLLNNAGTFAPQASDFGEVDEAVWLDVLKVNTIAPLRMAEAFVDHVAASERKIIATISSRMGSIEDNTSGGYYPYRSSKAGVNMVMRSLAADLRRRGITCVALSPGWVRTRMGGPQAPLTTEKSVAAMRAELARLTLEDTGKFLDTDGSEIPW